MLNGKGSIELARERLVKAQQAGNGQEEREEQEGRVGASPHGPGRWEGQREEPRPRRSGWNVNCWRRWENSTTRGGTGGPVRLVKGQVVIVDDTVDHNTPGGLSP